MADLRRQKRCHQCWCAVDSKALVEGLFCSVACRDLHAQLHEKARTQLSAAGFVNSPAGSNIWLRDSVALTEEEVKLNGLDTVLEKHQIVADAAAAQREKA